MKKLMIVIIKGSENMGRYIKNIIFIVGIIVILNYIPIQFAVKVPQEENLILYCVTEPKLDDRGSKWIALKSDDAILDDNLIFDIIGDDPNEILNAHYFDVKSWHRNIRDDGSVSDTLENVFIIYHKNTLDNISLTSMADVKNWDIIYPIKRAGLRKFITPKAYLSIYDFNLAKISKLIKHIMP